MPLNNPSRQVYLSELCYNMLTTNPVQNVWSSFSPSASLPRSQDGFRLVAWMFMHTNDDHTDRDLQFRITVDGRVYESGTTTMVDAVWLSLQTLDFTPLGASPYVGYGFTPVAGDPVNYMGLVPIEGLALQNLQWRTVSVVGTALVFTGRVLISTLRSI